MSQVAQPFEGGLRLTVRARPGTSRTRQARVVDCGDGKTALELTVAAAAVDGKANKAILAALADLFGVKKAAVTLKSGTTSRLKIVEIAGDPAALMERMRAFGDK